MSSGGKRGTGTGYLLTVRPATSRDGDGRWRAGIPELGIEVEGFGTETEAADAARSEHSRRMRDPAFQERSMQLLASNPERFSATTITREQYEAFFAPGGNGSVRIDPAGAISWPNPPDEVRSDGS